MTVNVRPAIVTVPVREEVVVLAATVTVALPPPLPDPDATVSHPALLLDVQAQPLAAVTVTAIDSPAAGDVRVAGLMV